MREVIEQRSFTTRRGTTQSAERRTYKISDSGIDRLEAASMYQRSEVASHINITNIRGVTVLGDGNVVNTTFADLSRVLNDLKQAVLREPLIKDTDNWRLQPTSTVWGPSFRSLNQRRALSRHFGRESRKLQRLVRLSSWSIELAI